MRSHNDLPGWHLSDFTAICPRSTVLVGGGCGHRDFNAAQGDIQVNYTGPDPSQPRTNFRCRTRNASAATRAITVFAMCMAVTDVQGP